MAPEESTLDLSDEELTRRLRIARGQPPVRAATADSISDQIRKAADKLKGESYDFIGIDDARIDLHEYVPHRTFEWKVPVDYVHTVKPIHYTSGTSIDLDNDIHVGTSDDTAHANALALAGGTTTGRLSWTDK